MPKSKQLAMDLVSVVATEQSQVAQEEADAAAEEEDDGEGELVPEAGYWSEPGDYAILGIGVAVAGAVLGLITLLAKSKAKATDLPDLPPLPPAPPTP